MASQPIDQGAILQSGRASIQDYAADQLRQQLANAQTQQANTQAQQVHAAISRQQQEQQRQAAYMQEIQAYQQAPTSQGLVNIMARYPEFSEGANRAFQAQDGQQKDADFRSAAEIHGAAIGGHYDLAASQLRARDEADRAAGQSPDPTHAAILADLESGDPARQSAATQALSGIVSYMAGPERFAAVHGALNPAPSNIEREAEFYRRTLPPAQYQAWLHAQADPTHWVPVTAGGFVQGVNNEGPLPGAQASDPATPAPPAPPAGGGGSAHPTTAAALNNPGGIRIPGTRTFARYATPAEGVAAQETLLRNHYLDHPTTIAQVIERYAPRRSRGGDNSDAQVNNYISYVARRLGISPSQPIDATFTAPLAHAMREVETGQRGRGVIAHTPGGRIRVRSMQEATSLAPGTPYETPDGQRFTR